MKWRQGVVHNGVGPHYARAPRRDHSAGLLGGVHPATLLGAFPLAGCGCKGSVSGQQLRGWHQGGTKVGQSHTARSLTARPEFRGLGPKEGWDGGGHDRRWTLGPVLGDGLGGAGSRGRGWPTCLPGGSPPRAAPVARRRAAPEPNRVGKEGPRRWRHQGARPVRGRRHGGGSTPRSLARFAPLCGPRTKIEPFGPSGPSPGHRPRPPRRSTSMTGRKARRRRKSGRGELRGKGGRRDSLVPPGSRSRKLALAGASENPRESSSPPRRLSRRCRRCRSGSSAWTRSIPEQPSAAPGSPTPAYSVHAGGRKAAPSGPTRRRDARHDESPSALGVSECAGKRND